MTTRPLTIGLFLAFLAIPGSHVFAQSSHDDQSKAVLQSVQDYLQELDALNVRAEVSYKIVDPAETATGAIEVTVGERDGEGYSFTVKEGDFERTTIGGGDETYDYLSNFNQYTVSEAEGGLIESMSGMGNGPLEPSFMLLAELFQEKPFAEYLDGATGSQYVGVEPIDGVDHHHISVQHDKTDFDLWVAKGDTPKISRIVPDVSDFGKEFGDDVKFETAVNVNEWSVNGAVAETFAFNPPKDAEKVPFFFDPANRPAGLALLGRQAPPIKLDMAGGGKFDLSEHKGKNVVILDFWASWCGPCRMAMPIIEKVADEYKDKGVVLYAVNLQETTDKINGFLKDNNLSVNVPVDRSGAVADKYYAHSIPQTVIVGKDGVVEVLHVGFSPQLEEQLRNELDKLLEGKQLATRPS